ncbi:MAG: hypothetical protein DI498_03325 [Paracoccus denitrificans]|nr:MAG: hypothetical protein DI498_03325 [Paracoccus denitrificans]PZO85559.1 MAG: hypothetical protein DI633_03325 [Paracoccus denitrificans]
MTDRITPLPVTVTDAAAAERIDRLAPMPRPVQTPPTARDIDANTPSSAAASPARGFSGILDTALGPTNLPDPVALIAALDAAAAHAGEADKAIPGLGRLVEAVIRDESYKLGRYMDLRGA